MPGKAGTTQFPGYRPSERFPQALTFHLADAQGDTKNPTKHWAEADISVEQLLETDHTWNPDNFNSGFISSCKALAGRHSQSWASTNLAGNAGHIKQGGHTARTSSPGFNPATKIHTKLKGMEEGGKKWDIRANPAFLGYHTGICSSQDQSKMSEIQLLLVPRTASMLLT